MATDGQDQGVSHRVPVPTEKGELFQAEQKETLIKRVKASGFMLNETIKNLQTLPETIPTLESANTDLRNSYIRYDKDANDYMDHLSRSRHPDSQSELETYWPIMTDFKKQYNILMDKIHSEIELLDNRSSDKRSTSTRKSGRSDHSNKSARSEAAALKRAKAESEKVKLQFVEKEAELKLEQFNKTLQIEILEQQKNAAAAEVEAKYLEENADEQDIENKITPPKEKLGAFEKTIQFLENLQPPRGSQHKDQQETTNDKTQNKKETHTLSPESAEAEPFIPKTSKQKLYVHDVATSTPRIPQPAHVHASVSTSYDNQIQQDTCHQFDNFPQPNVKNTIASDNQDNLSAPPLDPSTFLMKRNILLETFQKQKFNDKPDGYIIWKNQFKVMTEDIKCTPLEEITLLTNCVLSGTEAMRVIISTRSSFANNPSLCLDQIWERLDQRFGSAELLESALNAKLHKLPNMIDRRALYELYDVLCEIQSVKNLAQYSMTFSYLDSSLGIRPIVQKLPKFLQDKWINRVVNYKHDKQVIFPPFSEFVKFIHEVSIVRNDPGLMFDTPTSANQNRNNHYSKSQNQTNNTKRGQPISVHMTHINSNIPLDNRKKLCLIHKNPKHTINECKAFQSKSLQERKNILKEHNICFKCCETSHHFAKTCQATVKCNLCNSTSHCSALHNEQSQSTSEKRHGEEVSVKCTDICGIPGFTGKSCARIVPVRVCAQNDTGNALLTYAMLDDQSSQTLAKSSLFDHFSIHSPPLEYTLESCSGKSTIHGRMVTELKVEGVYDNIQLALPPIIECDNIPDNHAEIPTPEVALHYPHMRDISDQFLPYDNSMKVMLLIGRDLPEAFHVLEQRIGPPRSPFAQRTTLGWTIIGDVCLSGTHRPQSVSVYNNFVSENERPSSLNPCEQVIRVYKNLCQSR